ncbi:MAG: RsmD family RNA methyltransferase [Planctomycetota bacterium]
MRIIGGTAKGVRLASVPRRGVRPTLDRVRESVFNVLAPRLPGASFLDLFAGTGAIGLEAASRGARRVRLVERHPAQLDLIRQNAMRAKLQGQIEVRRGDVLRGGAPFQGEAWDLVYLDPPFQIFEGAKSRAGLSKMIRTQLMPACSPDAWILVEQPVRAVFEPGAPADRWLRYGETAIALLTVEIGPEPRPVDPEEAAPPEES